MGQVKAPASISDDEGSRSAEFNLSVQGDRPFAESIRASTIWDDYTRGYIIDMVDQLAKLAITHGSPSLARMLEEVSTTARGLRNGADGPGR